MKACLLIINFLKSNTNNDITVCFTLLKGFLTASDTAKISPMTCDELFISHYHLHEYKDRPALGNIRYVSLECSRLHVLFLTVLIIDNTSSNEQVLWMSLVDFKEIKFLNFVSIEKCMYIIALYNNSLKFKQNSFIYHYLNDDLTFNVIINAIFKVC